MNGRLSALCLLVCLACAPQAKRTGRLLDEIECFAKLRPDSALAALKRIGPDQLSTKALRARHALMLTMAARYALVKDYSNPFIIRGVSMKMRTSSRPR